MRPLFTNRYRHFKRYREIANVLSRHGLGYLLETTGLDNLFRLPWQKREPQGPPSSIAQRIRMVLEELGPAFIKLGQVLSTRPDLLPAVYITELELLQDQVPPLSFPEIKASIEAELHQSLEQLFASFDTTPLASASIGQVHQARLTGGEHIVVKVQRPGSSRKVQTDLEILQDFARIVTTRTEWGKLYQLQDLVSEFAQTIREELNYTFEAHNAERLRRNFLNDPQVRIPKVYWNYTTPRILVLEYCAGVKITAINELGEREIETRTVVHRLARAFFKQLLIDGFFHADLHPGNLAVTDDGAILFMDFGVMGRLDEDLRQKLGAMLLAVIRRNADGILRLLVAIGSVSPKVNRRKLRRELARLMDRYATLPLQEVKIGLIFRELLDLSFTYQIRIPRELILVVRCLVLLESLIERLDPRSNLMELAQPFAGQLLREKLEPARLAKTALAYLEELSSITLELPKRLNNICESLEAGELKIKLEHQNLGLFITRLNLMGNRLSFSLIVAAIIIGSSLIALKKTPQSFFGKFPVAEAGFLVAVLMGIWLLISIIRSGRI